MVKVWLEMRETTNRFLHALRNLVRYERVKLEGHDMRFRRLLSLIFATPFCLGTAFAQSSYVANTAPPDAYLALKAYPSGEQPPHYGDGQRHASLTCCSDAPMAGGSSRFRRQASRVGRSAEEAPRLTSSAAPQLTARQTESRAARQGK